MIAHRPAANQGGQAAVETVVALLALAVLLVLVPILAKYQDISHQAELEHFSVSWKRKNALTICWVAFSESSDVSI